MIVTLRYILKTLLTQLLYQQVALLLYRFLKIVDLIFLLSGMTVYKISI